MYVGDGEDALDGAVVGVERRSALDRHADQNSATHLESACNVGDRHQTELVSKADSLAAARLDDLRVGDLDVACVGVLQRKRVDKVSDNLQRWQTAG